MSFFSFFVFGQSITLYIKLMAKLQRNKRKREGKLDGLTVSHVVMRSIETGPSRNRQREMREAPTFHSATISSLSVLSLQHGFYSTRALYPPFLYKFLYFLYPMIGMAGALRVEGKPCHGNSLNLSILSGHFISTFIFLFV